MELNADFSKRAAVHAAKLPWQKSPMKGVERRMLDRIGDEVARATSIVRYAPNSHFSPHTHTGGEEFLVLDGIFQDEYGDYPSGNYVRNPPQSSHTPRSEKGCIIFVKLWQFEMSDRTQINIDTNTMVLNEHPGRKGISTIELFQDDREDVSIEKWPAGTKLDLKSRHGLEILVLDGGFREAGEEFSPQSWLRLPQNINTQASVGPAGCRLWIKRHRLVMQPTMKQGPQYC